jgi:S1-C subfamily serine protease
MKRWKIQKVELNNNIQSKKNRFRILTLVLIIGILFGSLVGYSVGYYLFITENKEIQNQLSVLYDFIEEIRFEEDSKNQEINDLISTLEDNLSQFQSEISDLRADVDTSDQEWINTINEIAFLEEQVLSIKTQISDLEETLENTDNISLNQLFEQVRESVVVVQGLVPQTQGFTGVQGSGFVYNNNEENIILTNYHVVEDTVSITVTFTNGETYDAIITGSNPNNDFAILSTEAPPEIYNPLEIEDSSTLKVGHSVIVVGTPYGLEGSLSTGIVSALNRTISIDGVTLTNIIQTTTPLNPGNSGGPMMNLSGNVVGITTAIAEESQGIGFAIPSNIFMNDIQLILGS